MVYNDPTQPVPAMDQIPPDQRPPIWLPFQTFHLMVRLGSLMIGVAAARMLVLVTRQVFRNVAGCCGRLC